MEMGKMSSIITVRSIMLVLIIFYGSVGAISPRSFDFFYFVQQWPATFYHVHNSSKFCYPNKTERPSDFSIHGLWPSYKNGTWPKYCSSSPEFDFSQNLQVSHLEVELCKYWPSFKYNISGKNLTCANECGNMEFWAHEWKMHGTCCYSELRDQLWYFNTTLSLRKRINLLRALDAKDIRPDGNKYSLISIRNAINESTGGFPRVICNNPGELYEVRVCVDKSDASTVIECPIYPRDNCTTTVVFPPFPSSLEENAIDGTDEL